LDGRLNEAASSSLFKIMARPVARPIVRRKKIAAQKLDAPGPYEAMRLPVAHRSIYLCPDAGVGAAVFSCGPAKSNG